MYPPAQMQARVEALEHALASASTDAASALGHELVADAAELRPDADAAYRALACRAMLAVCAQFCRTGRRHEAVAALSVAEALSETLAPAVFAAVRLRRIEVAVQHHDLGTAFEALGPLLAFTSQSGLRLEEARALTCYGLAMQAAGLHDQADGLFARALRLLDGLDLPHEAAGVWLCRVQLKACESSPALTAARHGCDQALELALAGGSRDADAMVATALCNRAAIELISGDAEVACACLDRAEALANLSAWQQWLIRLMRAMTELRANNDEHRRARIEALLHAPDAPSRGYLVESYAVLAALYTQLQDSPRAVSMLSRLADDRASGFAALITSGPDADFAWDDSAPGAARGGGSLMERIAVIAELRDDTTGRHCFRVGRLSALLAERAGLDAHAVQAMNLAARLHDLGKVAIPDAILLKPGRLDAHELALMQRHTLFGYELLADDADPVRRAARLIARHHHERWDGRGYPDGLAGAAIPIEARVAALADVFDALTHARPYKQAWSRAAALRYIEDAAGSHFDPELTRHFLDLMRAADADWQRFYDGLEADACGSSLVESQARLTQVLADA